MASFRKRNGRWQVQIRRLGKLPLSKTFRHKRDAEAWARLEEARLDQGTLHQDQVDLGRITLNDLIVRYRDVVVVSVPRQRLWA